MENALEINSTDNPENHASDRYDRDLDWSDISRYLLWSQSLMVSSTSTAAVSTLNLILFVSQGNHSTYYQTTAAILGKMYSNTMMVVLNSRIVFSQKESNDYSSIMSISDRSRRRQTIPHGDIVVTREQWTTPAEAWCKHGYYSTFNSHWYWYYELRWCSLDTELLLWSRIFIYTQTTIQDYWCNV